MVPSDSRVCFYSQITDVLHPPAPSSGTCQSKCQCQRRIVERVNFFAENVFPGSHSAQWLGKMRKPGKIYSAGFGYQQRRSPRCASKAPFTKSARPLSRAPSQQAIVFRIGINIGIGKTVGFVGRDPHPPSIEMPLPQAALAITMARLHRRRFQLSHPQVVIYPIAS